VVREVPIRPRGPLSPHALPLPRLQDRRVGTGRVSSARTSRHTPIRVQTGPLRVAIARLPPDHGGATAVTRANDPSRASRTVRWGQDPPEWQATCFFTR